MDTKEIIIAVIIGVYLVVTFVVGMLASSWMKRRRSAAAATDAGREEEYFLAGRKVPGWLAGTSVGVTSMNADVAPAYAGVAIVVGLPVAWFYLSRFALGLMIAAVLFAYLWRRMNVGTAPEFYALRFGGRGGTFVRSWVSVYSVILGMVPWIGAGLLGVHQIFGPVFGYEAKAVTLLMVLPVLMIYVWSSGYAGVLATDLLQSVVIVAANVAAAAVVLGRFGGPTGLAEAITNSLAASDAAAVLSATPVPGHSVMGPLVVLAWFLVPTIGFGGNVSTDGQRLLSCATPKEAMKSYVWSAVVLFVMLMTLTLPVLGLLPLHPELYTASPGEREKAYGMLLAEFLPAPLLGLALAALSAAVMSTISSHLNYGSQTLLNDVARVFYPGLQGRRALLVGHLFGLAMIAGSVAVVYQAGSLIGIAITLLGFFGATVAFHWAQWWWWRANFPAWVSAQVVGPFIYLGLGPVLNSIDWWSEMVAKGGATADAMGMLHALVGMGISTALWMTVACVTKPEDMEMLKTFYRRVRPIGAWGPVRDAVIAEESGKVAEALKRPMILPGVGVAALGAAWMSMAVMALSQFFVGAWGLGLTLGAASAITALASKSAFNWYYERMEARF